MFTKSWLIDWWCWRKFHNLVKHGFWPDWTVCAAGVAWFITPNIVGIDWLVPTGLWKSEVPQSITLIEQENPKHANGSACSVHAKATVLSTRPIASPPAPPAGRDPQPHDTQCFEFLYLFRPDNTFIDFLLSFQVQHLAVDRAKAYNMLLVLKSLSEIRVSTYKWFSENLYLSISACAIDLT